VFVDLLGLVICFRKGSFMGAEIETMNLAPSSCSRQGKILIMFQNNNTSYAPTGSPP